MDINQQLEQAWSKPNGFLGRLREGAFDEDGFASLVALLKALDFGEEDVVGRRTVALTWYIPTFMQWQEHRLMSKGGDVGRLRRAVTEVQNELERVLGVP